MVELLRSTQQAEGPTSVTAISSAISGVRGSAAFGQESVDRRPDSVEIDGELVASRNGFERSGARAEGVDVASVGPELEDLEQAQLGIYEPVEADAEGSVVAELVDSVTAGVSRFRGNDFDHDVRRHPDGSSPGGGSSVPGR